MVDVNDFISEKECVYKGRTYTVRDNGSVYRHQKEDSRPAPLDNHWTFGKKDEKTGYMMIAGVRIHQIVATAFHGTPEHPTMVVDHIDTNRCNNRPENLRWLTRLENALNNPYTRSRIIYLCGSIEAFLNNPSILRQSASDSNTSWMRTVTNEEAAKCLKWLDKWDKEDNLESRSSSNTGKGIGEWIYSEKIDNGFENTWDTNWETRETRRNFSHEITNIETTSLNDNGHSLALKESLTPGAKQLNWKIPTEFPLSPQEISSTPLQDYLNNLVKGKTFCKNKYYDSVVLKADISTDGEHIAVITSTNGATNFALAEIRYNDGYYVHKSIRTFFTDKGAKKDYNQSLGHEWTGGEVFEDYF